MKRLRILTWNLWHGLDHSKQWLMWPLESRSELKRRYEAQIIELKAWLGKRRPEQLDLLAFQELNPWNHRVLEIKRRLKIDGFGAGVNEGIRWGDVGFPPFLKEGLGLFWRGEFHSIRRDYMIVTEGGTQLPPLLGRPVSVQWKERRAVLRVGGIWNDLPITLTTLHLHHGRPSRENRSVRKQEMVTLVKELEKVDLSEGLHLVCGDWNCDPEDPELEPIRKLGFSVVHPNFPQGVTWDPDGNPTCRESAVRTTQGEEQKWDLKRHRLDHIWCNTRSRSWKLLKPKMSVEIMKTEVSDHYPVALTLNFQLPPRSR